MPGKEGSKAVPASTVKVSSRNFVSGGGGGGGGGEALAGMKKRAEKLGATICYFHIISWRKLENSREGGGGGGELKLQGGGGGGSCLCDILCA